MHSLKRSQSSSFSFTKNQEGKTSFKATKVDYSALSALPEEMGSKNKFTGSKLPNETQYLNLGINEYTDEETAKSTQTFLTNLPKKFHGIKV